MLNVLFFAALGGLGTLGVARRALVRGWKGHVYCGALVLAFFGIPLGFAASPPFLWQALAGLTAGTLIMVILGPLLVPARSRLRPSDRTFI